MRALVVFESMFGNTEAVARAVAGGLGETFEVTVADVAGRPDAAGADLVVVGGPTHAFGMSRPSSRQQAAERGTVRAGAAEVGIREYLDALPPLTGVAAAAFDTTADKPFLTGSAARKAQRHLRRLGCRVVVPAESFRVTGTTGPLVAREEDRARRWGAALAAAAKASRQRA
jgi:Flavodoxin